MTAKRFLIACGGTGGHFYPGYVLGKALRERGHEVLFLLRTGDPAARTLFTEDFPFVEADLRGMPRRPSLESLRFAVRLAAGLRLTLNILNSWRPSAVVGMGGYLTFPAVAAASWRGIPSLLHESNAVLGLANRACLRLVSKAALGLPIDGAARWPAPFALTGTPVRPEIWAPPDKEEARRSLGLAADAATVLIFGGSQGARAINEAAPPALKKLALGRKTRLQCLHLAGRGREDDVQAAYSGAPLKAAVLPYLDDMGKAYAASDLVVCRAGASTLAELAAARKPAVLIPYPYAAADHQTANAGLLTRAGAAVCLEESALTPASLAAAIGDLISSGPGSEARLLLMARGYDCLHLPPPRETLKSLVAAVESLSE